MISLNDLILSGKFQQIEQVSTVEAILEFFGESEMFTPAHKSYPTMLVYGDLELRLRNNELEIITIIFRNKNTQIPPQLNPDPFRSKANRRFATIEALLKQNQLSWRKDEIMSDESQEVYISENRVHWAFYNGVLTKIGIERTKRNSKYF